MNTKEDTVSAPSEKRTHQLHVCVNTQEREAIDARAQLYGMSRADFLRAAALGKRMTDQKLVRQFRQIYGELCDVKGTLEQTATLYKANGATEQTGRRIESALISLIDAVERVYDKL